MTNSYQVCLTICTGAFLVSWETLALVYQGWANKSWGTALFAFFGGFVLALGLLGVIMCNVLSKRKRKNTKEHKSGKEEIEVTPIDPDTYTADITTAVLDTAEKKKKKQEEKADFIFDLINISTAMLTVIITVLFLNTFTSLWLRGVLHGRGAVRLSYGINEGTRALLSSSEPMINFYNARLSEVNYLEYKHEWRKYCAAPIISVSYDGNRRNYSGYWGRCSISSSSDCTSSLKHECLKNFGSQLKVGRRASLEEEKSLGIELQKLHISDTLPVLVDVNKPEKQQSDSKKGLFFAALNLVWLIPTVGAVVFFSLQ